MELFSLIIYAAVNLAMLGYYMRGAGMFLALPFWIAAISMGWFFPQAIGGYTHLDLYPEHAFSKAMFFAAFCNLGVWGGYAIAVNRCPAKPSWLSTQFEVSKLIAAGSIMCVTGLFFYWKLMSLPEEVLAQTQWSGAAVKYRFLSNIFKMGFLALWLVYLHERKLMNWKILPFVTIGFLMFFEAAVMRGRRAEMMNLTACILGGLWFVRNIPMPRGLLLAGLGFGLLFINTIGVYRTIMKDKDASMAERVQQVSSIDYSQTSKKIGKEAGVEFNNYLFYRQHIEDQMDYDFGLFHWNGTVFYYVPAQLVGRGVKKALMFPIHDSIKQSILRNYGHRTSTGSTLTGYYDAFASFGWLGFVKFVFLGMIMGALYRHAMSGSFLGQLLYIHLLGPAMHAITHQTQGVLVSVWVYFFLLIFPVFFWFRLKPEEQTMWHQKEVEQ